MRKQYSQITFEFQDPPDSGENAGVGVRIKALKKAADQKAEQENDEDQLRDEQTESGAEDAFDPQFSSRNTTDRVSDEVAEISSEPATTTDENDEANTHDEASASVVKTVKSTRGRKSLKTIDDGTELINIPPDEELFKKQYYAIGEVAEMFHVNQSLLRFWETEFDIIQPRKNRKGDRHFRPIDIKNLLLIHDLLRRRKLTIEGAKDFLKKNKRTPERFAMIQSLQKIKGFILEVKATL